MEETYWDKQAAGYDSHMKRSENAYLRITELMKNEISAPQNLLDIGTGTGEIPIALSGYAEKIYATDLSSEMIDIAEQKLLQLKISNISFQVQDCYDLNFENEYFDVIIASNLLHILEKPEEFLLSVKRLLKRNGKLLIPTFLHNENIRTRIISAILKFKGHPINSRFDSKSIVSFIEQCGFNIEKKIFIKSTMPILFLAATKK